MFSWFNHGLTMVKPPFLDVLTIAYRGRNLNGGLQSHVHGHEGRVRLGGDPKLAK